MVVEQVIPARSTLKEKVSHLYYASAAFLGVKALDILSTSLCAKKYNDLSMEQNWLTRRSMETFGVDAGLAIKNIPAIALTLAGGYFMHKAFEDSKHKALRNLGAASLYASSAYGLYVVGNNISQLV